MRFDVVLGRLFGVLHRVKVVAVRQMCVMSGPFVKTLLVMTGGLAMMTRSVFVMLRCLLVVLCCFMRHGEFLSSCRHLCGTGGLS